MHIHTHISSREGTFYRLHFGNALVSFSLMLDLLISFKWYYSYKSAFILLPLNFSEVLYGLNEFQKIFLDYQLSPQPNKYTQPISGQAMLLPTISHVTHFREDPVSPPVSLSQLHLSPFY